jgi:transcriptional regulator with XRE-family HTH domain
MYAFLQKLRMTPAVRLGTLDACEFVGCPPGLHRYLLGAGAGRPIAGPVVWSCRRDRELMTWMRRSGTWPSCDQGLRTFNAGKESTMRSQTRASTASPVRQRVGPTIKALRYQKGMSLNTLADSAGISPSHLSRIERGLTVPSYDVLDRIAESLGSDLSALRNDEQHARAVDEQLDRFFGQMGLDSNARSELLRLSHETRQSLATSLERLAGSPRASSHA